MWPVHAARVANLDPFNRLCYVNRKLGVSSFSDSNAVESVTIEQACRVEAPLEKDLVHKGFQKLTDHGHKACVRGRHAPSPALRRKCLQTSAPVQVKDGLLRRGSSQVM